MFFDFFKFGKKKVDVPKQSRVDKKITEDLDRQESSKFLINNPHLSDKLKAIFQGIVDKK